jgi:hypothetical protein
MGGCQMLISDYPSRTSDSSDFRPLPTSASRHHYIIVTSSSPVLLSCSPFFTAPVLSCRVLCSCLVLVSTSIPCIYRPPDVQGALIGSPITLQWVKKLSQCLAVLERLTWHKSNKLSNNLKIIYVILGYLGFYINLNARDLKQN